MPSRYDVVIATDCRLPGGTAVSTAEEVSAQATAGLSSGLLHLESPLVSRTRPLNPRLRDAIARGDADLLLPDERIATRLLVLRHPKVALGLPSLTDGHFDVDECVVLANQVPIVDGRVIYTAAEVNSAVESVVGRIPLWAPIGPLVREEFAAAEPAQAMMEDDWVNIIDVDSWAVERPPLEGRPVRIGRHSRDHYLKWPSNRQDMLAAYPTADDVIVNVLGGIPQAATVLGGTFPPNWNTFPFGSRHPMDFLADVDVFVYFHHRELTEAFGRNILEAMASGAPVVTDRKFQPLFGDSVLYTEPDGVLDVVRGLAADPARYRELSRLGQDFARDRFGYEEHVRRVRELVDIEPRPTPRPIAVTDPGRSTRNVLFISPNGAGMGHLARMMAVASRLPAELTPRFLTFSTAAAVVEQAGYLVDYVPSRPVTSSASTGWHQALAAKVASVIAQASPVAVVIDGTEPYRGILRALIAHPEIPVVWSRRGMWRAGVSNAVLETGADFFDLVLEPGELAEEFDTGVTRAAPSQRVGPVTYVKADEVLERDEARRELGLPLEGTLALIALGAGNINDTSSVLAELLDEAKKCPDAEVVTTNSPISLRARGLEELATTISVFPLARYLAAFDLAVAAAGYNSFHEFLIGRVPTLFIPNLETITDDQLARARWAEANGLAMKADERDLEDVRTSFSRLLNSEQRARLSDALDSLSWTDGASEMAARVVEVARTHEGTSPARTDTRRAAYERIEVEVKRRSASLSTSDSTDQLGPREKFKRVARRTIGAAQVRLGDERSASLLGRAPARVQARVQRLMTGGTAIRHQRKAPLLRVPPGRLIPDEQEARLERFLIVIDGRSKTAEIVEAVARRQMIERTFAPVFLTSDLASGAAFARYGYVWEHLRRRSEAETDEEWAERRITALGQVRRWYRPTFVVAVESVADVDDHSHFADYVRTLDPT